MGTLFRILIVAVFGGSCSFASAKECIEYFSHLTDDAIAKSGGAENRPRPQRLSEVRKNGVKDFEGRSKPLFLKSRERFEHPSVKGLRERASEYVEVVVKFEDDAEVDILNGRLTALADGDDALLAAIFRGFPAFVFKPENQNKEWVTALRFCAADNTGHDFADPTAFFSAKIPAGQAHRAVDLVESLLAHPLVETAWMRGRGEPAGAVTPGVVQKSNPDTALFEHRQRYFDAPPTGIGLRSVWDHYPGIKGANIRYADFENGWTRDHEDFPKDAFGFSTLQQLWPYDVGQYFDPSHGNGVVGILSGVHNAWGVHGGVPDAVGLLAPEAKLSIAALLGPDKLRAGDVLLIEYAWNVDQAGGTCPSGPASLPWELDNTAFNGIQLLVANGVVVVEGAGNGALSLSHPCMATRMSRDSGAIIVGAGATSGGPNACSATNEEPTLTAATFSNYGDRIDTNAWGQCVTTTGKYPGTSTPDLAGAGLAEQRYYMGTFAGTSSAGAIIAAAAIAVQGWQKARTQRTYQSQVLRSLFREYGTPTSGSNKIGKQASVSGMIAGLLQDGDSDGTTYGDELSLPDLITHYFQTILGRNPDPGGKVFWFGEVERMRALKLDPREAYRVIAKLFYESPEYIAKGKSDSAFVTDLYATFFQRAPDAGGLAYWTSQLAQGLNRESVLQSFMHSAEFTSYMNVKLTPTPQSVERKLLMDVYRGIYGRFPDEGGLNYWRGRMCSAILQGPAAVSAEAYAFVSAVFPSSAEYAGRNRNPGQKVADLYDAILGRGAEAGGFNFWVGQLNYYQPYGAEYVRDQFLNPTPGSEWALRVNSIANQPCY